MANEGEIPLPGTPEEHLYLFVRSMGETLTSAYGRMQHPMLQGLRDQLFFDNVMVSVAQLRRKMESDRSGAQEGPTGKHIDMVLGEERVEAIGGYLSALLGIANAIDEKGGMLSAYLEKVKPELADIEQLSTAMYHKMTAEIKGEPAPPLEAKD